MHSDNAGENMLGTGVILPQGKLRHLMARVRKSFERKVSHELAVLRMKAADIDSLLNGKPDQQSDYLLGQKVGIEMSIKQIERLLPTGKRK